MKTILISAAAGILFSLSAKSQNIDTVDTYAFGKMPPIYMANKLYWERNHDKPKNDESTYISYIALSYNHCHVGDYTSFFPNGKVKSAGQYKENTTGDWTDLHAKGLCSVPTGIWKNYSEDGTLNKTVEYDDNGNVIKEY